MIVAFMVPVPRVRTGNYRWHRGYVYIIPRSNPAQLSGSAGIELSVTDLALILNGIDLATARRRKRYCRVG
jgi:hypothetical protein